MSPSELVRMLGLDGVDQVAIGAFDHFMCVGIARYSRLEETRDVAEMTLSIHPSYRHLAIGEELSRRLEASAVSNGILSLRTN